MSSYEARVAQRAAAQRRQQQADEEEESALRAEFEADGEEVRGLIQAMDEDWDASQRAWAQADRDAQVASAIEEVLGFGTPQHMAAQYRESQSVISAQRQEATYHRNRAPRQRRIGDLNHRARQIYERLTEIERRRNPVRSRASCRPWDTFCPPDRPDSDEYPAAPYAWNAFEFGPEERAIAARGKPRKKSKKRK